MLVVAGQNRHGGLHDDRPVIHLGAYEMHGAADEAHAFGERARMRIEAGEGGEQRGMDVDHPVAPMIDEARGQQPHEAGEADELDARRFERLGERRLESFAARIVAMGDDGAGDAGALRVIETAGIGAVADDERAPGREIFLRASAHERFEIGAAARDQYRGLQPGHALSVPLRIVPSLPAPSSREGRSTMRPISMTRSPAFSIAARAAAASLGATMAIMPMPQLKVRAISLRSIFAASASQRNTGGNSQRVASSSAAR